LGKNGPSTDAISNNPNLDLSSTANGICLCKIYHKKVDDDPDYYTVETLLSWRKLHEEVIRNFIIKESAPKNIIYEGRRSHTGMLALHLVNSQKTVFVKCEKPFV